MIQDLFGWLLPTISVVARDRCGGYGEAAAKALAHAMQVADPWHLTENYSRGVPFAPTNSDHHKIRASRSRFSATAPIIVSLQLFGCASSSTCRPLKLAIQL
ncbi:hypothetical protein ACFQX9_16400 [Bradyrhizobium sp. GCM10028915]|uniref:hypothetical protein n=1 Tax=Bradyrhizobium sp. GCM10028915 TaxID=3273385 RepID=UPI0036136F6D